MAITAEQRARLDEIMNARRLRLGITWRDVAVRAGLSYEVLRKLRSGTGGIRDLTGAQISKGLGWEPSSVQAILDGGEPTVAAQQDIELRCLFEAFLAEKITDPVQLRLRIEAHRRVGHSPDCLPAEEDPESSSALIASL